MIILLFIVLIFANVLWTFLTIAIVASGEDIVKKKDKKELEPIFMWEDENGNWIYKLQ
jgi:hypothetical protein